MHLEIATNVELHELIQIGEPLGLVNEYHIVLGDINAHEFLGAHSTHSLPIVRPN